MPSRPPVREAHQRNHEDHGFKRNLDLTLLTAHLDAGALGSYLTNQGLIKLSRDASFWLEENDAARVLACRFPRRVPARSCGAEPRQRQGPQRAFCEIAAAQRCNGVTRSLSSCPYRYSVSLPFGISRRTRAPSLIALRKSKCSRALGGNSRISPPSANWPIPSADSVTRSSESPANFDDLR